MLAEPNSNGGHTPKLRTACENCRQSKVKCNLSGKNTCIRCLRHGLQCRYGFANRSGKPKGSKNRATLRKMGQLPEERPGRSSLGDRRQPEFAVDRKCVAEPLLMSYAVGQSMDDKSESHLGRLSDSPRSFHGAVTVDTPLSTGHSSLGSFFESTASPGVAYPSDSLSPTFSPKESVKGMPEFSFPVHSPYSIQPPCECVTVQIYHMNQLSRVATATVQLQFDQSLQNIKTAMSSCRGFLQCSACQKDSANLLLSVSIFDLILQLFDHWITHHEAVSLSSGSDAANIRYGHYELDHQEVRRIGNFLMQGLLLQCREILGLLKETVDVCIGPRRLVSPELDNYSIGGSDAGFSALQLHPGQVSDGVNGNCLHHIMMGHEATVEAFLRTISLRECICN